MMDELLEADQDELFGDEDFKDIASNVADARQFLDEHVHNDNGLWVLASYSKFHGGVAGRANVEYFKDQYAGLVATRGSGAAYGEETVGIPDERAPDLDQGTLMRLESDLDRLESNPYLSEGHYAAAVEESRDSAWRGWIEHEFMRTLNRQYPQFEEQFWALKAEDQQSLFETLRDHAGAEWYEDTDGQQTVDLNDIYDSIDENILREYLFPPGAQLPFDFGPMIEALINGEPLEADDDDIVKSSHPSARKVKLVKGKGGTLEERTLRELQAMPDDQLYLCRDATVAERHKLPLPFECGCREWIGGGIVKVEFYSNDERYGRQFQSSDYAGIKTLEPVHGKTWRFDVLPSFESQEIVQESKEFSCVMAPAPDDLADYVLRWGQMFITDDELYVDDVEASKYGREHDPHITVKFGLHEVRPSETLLKLVEQTQPFEIEVGPASFFESEKFDVLKFDVTSAAMTEMNRRISEALECTDTHPEYHPHMTVAYVQKGCCRDLEGQFVRQADNPAQLRFLVKSVVFSSKDGNKYTLFLGKPNETIDGTGEVMEALGPIEGGTVVIHLDDRSTDFLQAIYAGKGYPVVSGGISKEELVQVMKSADRLYMMGHGAPHGLFGHGYMIGDEFGPLLREKKDGVYIWCNADAFAARHQLSGLVSGMFISEVGEAAYFGIKARQEEVDASNAAFARIVREAIDRGDPYSVIRDCYAASNAACKITQYNAERLYVFQEGQATPVLHPSSAYHKEQEWAKEQADWGKSRGDWAKKEQEGESALYRLRGHIASAAQAEYDAWEQDEEGMDAELGAGGLCQNIAEAISDVLGANGIEAVTVDAQVGDQHVWVMAKVGDVVYTVDIPPSVYETGSGYVWKKRQGVIFEPDDVVIQSEDVDWSEITESLESEPALVEG